MSLEEIITHDNTEDCVACRAQDIVAQILVPAAAAWEATSALPHFSLAIHGAVLVLSGPGLRAEAGESGLPLEVIEYRAVREAAADVAKNFGGSERKAFRVIAGIVSRFGGWEATVWAMLAFAAAGAACGAALGWIEKHRR